MVDFFSRPGDGGCYQTEMKLSDFELQPRGQSVYFNLYRSNDTIETNLGRFVVELMVHGQPKLPPDQKMVAEAEFLAAAILDDFDNLHTLIYNAYQWAANDKRWFAIFELPTDLKKDELTKIVHGGTILIEWDCESADTDYHSAIHVSQEWDEEHGLHFLREEGKWLRHDY